MVNQCLVTSSNSFASCVLNVADALFRSRSGEDHEATVLIKTQFMTFWDGLMTEEGCQILIMGATNRPDDVDAAILRRMPSKYYIGLPVSILHPSSSSYITLYGLFMVRVSLETPSTR